MKKLVALLMAAVMLFACMSFAMADEQITLNVWSFTNELQGMIEKYYAPNHPEINFVYQIYPTDGGEYTSKVDAMMSTAGASEEAPDVFTLEAAFVKKYVQTDWTADLKDVGFTDEEFAPAIPVMLQIGQNDKGVQKGLSWQSTPGVVMYRADLAEQYLGVTSPEEFQAKVADWDLFMETAAEINTASEGAVKMVIGAGDIWNAYQYNRSEGWVVDGKLVIDDELYDYLDICKQLEEDDLSWKGGSWSETWFAGMKGQLPTLCYFLPTWGLHYTLKPHCGEGTDDTMDDATLKATCEANGGTYGNWRLVAGPVGYSWGGTWVGANAAKVASADDAKKAAIKDLLYFFTLDADFLYTYAKESGDFVGNNDVVAKVVAENIPNPFLGGQDHYAIFAEAANLANGSLMTEYDETINSLWDNNVTTPYAKGEMELDACIEQFKAAVAAAFTNITVD